MYAAVIKLAYRADRESSSQVVLIPGGKFGAWLAGLLGFLITLGSIVLAFVPPGEVTNKLFFELKIIAGTVVPIAIGLILYWRGAKKKGGLQRLPEARG
jgi:preprotein translocase subunit Sss1